MLGKCAMWTLYVMLQNADSRSLGVYKTKGRNRFGIYISYWNNYKESIVYFYINEWCAIEVNKNSVN